MGRKAKLKQQRRQARREEINEVFDYCTNGRFLGEVQRLIRDSGANAVSSATCVRVLHDIVAEVTEHVEIVPLSVEAIAYNHVFADLIQRSGLDPLPGMVVELGDQGGRYAVLGAEDRKNESEDWYGHLVALVKAKGKPNLVIDMAIARINAPEDGILFKRPVVFVPPEGFVEGDSIATGFEVGPDGEKLALVYRVYPDDTGYTETVDWNRDYGIRVHDKIDFGDMPLVAPCPEGMEGTEGPPGEPA